MHNANRRLQKNNIKSKQMGPKQRVSHGFVFRWKNIYKEFFNNKNSQKQKNICLSYNINYSLLVPDSYTYLKQSKISYFLE